MNARRKTWIHGWKVFYWALRHQWNKKHGKGRGPILQMIYCAACCQYVADYQHRCPGKFPLHGRLAQWLSQAAGAK